MTRIPVGLQLYTLRDQLAEDYVGTIRRVAALGYEGVELAGTGPLSAAEWHDLLAELNLQVFGAHVSLAALESQLSEAIDFNLTIGNNKIVCPFLPEERRQTADDYRRVADSLNKIGSSLRPHGITLCYHNHAFEFQQFDGEYGLDMLFRLTDPISVQAELDTFWVEFADESAAAYVEKYAGRVPLLHIKDMTKTAPRTFAEIGEGIMDWSVIFSAAEKSGVEAYLVEQDRCTGDPFQSVELSLNNLRAMGKL